MIAGSVADLVVKCGGKLEDGSPCESEIKAQQKFCVICGTPVDQQLFSMVKEVCSNCGTPLIGSLFCPECGKKKKTATTGSGENYYIIYIMCTCIIYHLSRLLFLIWPFACFVNL